MTLLNILVIAVLPLVGMIIGAVTEKALVLKICGSIFSFELLFALWLFMELFAGGSKLSELFGTSILWLAFAICGGLFVIALLMIWRPFNAKTRRIAAAALAAALVAVTASAAGMQAYRNSFLEIGDADSEISLDSYRPFGDTGGQGDGTTRVALLDTPSSLAFTDNLPRLDGATALYPLYSAFVRATYPENDYDPYDGSGDSNNPVLCNQTSGAFDNLVYGHTDIAFLMGVSAEQAALARREGAALQMTPIGKEAFVFIVNSRNRMEDLTQDDIRAIYSGAVTNWREIGGTNDRIEAYQRPEGSGSQTALQKIMGGTPIIEPKGEQVYSFMGGLYNAVADYKNYKNAIGYSFRFYIETMLNDAELGQVKLLRIDGAAPTAENIANGTYPFGDEFYAVTVSNREPKDDTEKARLDNAKKLIDWILSAQGQELVAKTGYIAVE
jgi:phosphate transport system substrate-binding protein